MPERPRIRPSRRRRNGERQGTMAEQKQRGRDAIRPDEIPKAGWKDIALRVKDEIETDHVAVVSAGVAFFGLLAAFPAIAALMSIAGLVLDPSTIEKRRRVHTDFPAALPALTPQA